MRKLFIFYLLFSYVLFSACHQANEKLAPETAKHTFAIAIHGGAGALVKGNYTAEEEAAYLSKLKEA